MIHPLQWLIKWRFWQVEERIYWLVKGKPKELKPKHAKLTSIWEIRPEQGHKEHPAVFPIELPTRIIASLLEEEDGIVITHFVERGRHWYLQSFWVKSKICGICEEERVRVLRELSLHKILGQLIRNLPYNT